MEDNKKRSHPEKKPYQKVKDHSWHDRMKGTIGHILSVNEYIAYKIQNIAARWKKK